jgi:hypothetical protein
MFVLSCILAGIMGTFLMTLFTSLGSGITGYFLHVPSILGSMVTMKTQPSGKPSKGLYSLSWGYTLHYSIGIAFAFMYARLHTREHTFTTTYSNALIFGVIAGLAAVLFWFCFLKLHPLAPRVELNIYLLFIFLGHLVFALGMNTTFNLINHFLHH